MNTKQMQKAYKQTDEYKAKQKAYKRLLMKSKQERENFDPHLNVKQ